VLPFAVWSHRSPPLLDQMQVVGTAIRATNRTAEVTVTTLHVACSRRRVDRWNRRVLRDSLSTLRIVRVRRWRKDPVRCTGCDCSKRKDKRSCRDWQVGRDFHRGGSLSAVKSRFRSVFTIAPLVPRPAVRHSDTCSGDRGFLTLPIRYALASGRITLAIRLAVSLPV